MKAIIGLKALCNCKHYMNVRFFPPLMSLIIVTTTLKYAQLVNCLVYICVKCLLFNRPPHVRLGQPLTSLQITTSK